MRYGRNLGVLNTTRTRAMRKRLTSLYILVTTFLLMITQGQCHPCHHRRRCHHHHHNPYVPCNLTVVNMFLHMMSQSQCERQSIRVVIGQIKQLSHQENITSHHHHNHHVFLIIIFSFALKLRQGGMWDKCLHRHPRTILQVAIIMMIDLDHNNHDS